MALLSDLVRTLAQVEGLEEVSVGIYARHAREAGYITQAGRGRGAARMTVRDAANLIIAVNACALAKDVRYGVEDFRSLTSTGVRDAAFPEPIGKIFASRIQVGEALEILVESSVPDAKGDVPLLIAMEQTAGAWLKSPSRKPSPLWLDPDLAWIIQLEITFSRPKPEVEMTIIIKPKRLSRTDRRHGQEIIARALFPRHASGKWGDRRDRVTITDNTITMISEALAR